MQLFGEGNGNPVPEGFVSAFLSGTTLGIVDVDPVDCDVGTPVFVSLAKMLDDLKFRGAISDFDCAKDGLKSLDGYESVPLLVNENDKFGDGNNFIICSTAGAIETLRSHMQLIANPEAAAAAEVTEAVTAEEAAEPEPEPEPVFKIDEDAIFGEGSANDVPQGVESVFLTAATLKIVEVDEEAAEVGVLFLLDKQKVLDDIQFRGAISDFANSKKKIEAVEGDELAMLYNPNDKFGDGNNWILVVSAEVQAQLMADVEAQREAYEEEKRREQEDIERIAREKAERKANRGRPKAKPWMELGSAAELAERAVHPLRGRVRMAFSRPRRGFGERLKLSDRDAQELWSSGQMECRPHKDPNFELRRAEMEVGCQGVMPTADAGVQAAPGRPRNGATQSEPLQFTKAERKAAVGAPALASFLESVTSRMGHALQQNEVADLFLDDLAALADEDSAPGNRLENVISEFQSFTHLTYSKSKVVSAVDWMPGEHGAVGVACAARQSFDERLENAGAVGTAAVLVWNFVDPIHPQLVLESPADVMAFRFNPRRPEIVAGGMYNGQVALWDTRKVERRNTDRSRTQDALAAADADHEGAAAGVSVVSTSRLSAVEASHKMAITGLEWLPADMGIARGGHLRPGSSADTSFFATIAADGRLCFWDYRAKGQLSISSSGKKGEPQWVPAHVTPLARLDGAGDLGALKLCLAAPGSAAPARFFCASEDGDVVFASFDKSGGGGGGAGAGDAGDGAVGGAPGGAGADGVPASPGGNGTMLWSNDAHCGPVKTVARSPFFSDVVMTVADFSFRVWREGKSSPIFSSASAATYLTSGCWSPSRPGVLFVARADGLLEAWDLLDRSHEPSMVATVASSAVTSLEFSSQATPQLLAAGDESGVLHIVEMPRSLRRPVAGEQATMAAFLSREEARVEYRAELLSARGDGGSGEATRARPAKESSAGGLGSGAVNASADTDSELGGDGEGDGGKSNSDDDLTIKAEEKVYQKMLAAFKVELGIVDEAGGGIAA